MVKDVGTLELVSGIMRWKTKKWEKPTINDSSLTKWFWMVQYPEKLKIGKYVDIGTFTYINALYGVEISDFVQIGSHCSIYSISTIDGRKGKVVIKRNARIGSHSLIMPGVTIGENSIVGAFSFVNRDIPDNVVALGIPVKVARKLKDSEISAMIKAMDEVGQINGE